MDPLQIWVRNMDRKKEIRAKILKMRQALPKEEVREKSLRIMRRIEETETFKNAVDMLFEELEKEEPEHFAVRQYKKYKLAAGDICSK